MHAFARLLDSLSHTQSRNRKIALLGRYFRATPDPDRGWALAALTDGVPIRLPLRRMLTDLVSRFIDPVLYRLSRDYVGDTAETVALLWPDTPHELSRSPGQAKNHDRSGDLQKGSDRGAPVPYSNLQEEAPEEASSRAPAAPASRAVSASPEKPPHPSSPLPFPGRGRGWGDAASEHVRQLTLDLAPTENPIAQELEEPGENLLGHNSGGGSPALSLSNVIAEMADGTTAERTERLSRQLDRLDVTGRWALLKLLGGASRVGVSARLARTALADCYGRDVAEIEEIWHALEPPYLELFAWLDGKTERPDPGTKPVFRPVMLAHPVEDEDWPRMTPEDFVAEWKWDGIRVQIAARGSAGMRMFSRQGDDISGAFPEIRSAFTGQDCVVDGELLVLRDGEIAPFNDLQQRLNRKTVTAKMMSAYPPHVRLYDLLFDGDEDLRASPLVERRARLEAWHARHHPPLTDVSPLVLFETFADLGKLWASSRAEGIEGLMLKRRDSAYQAGRIKGQWFKWKRAALTLDCVLMYAQRGSGKRSSYYSDYTFGVWQPNEHGELQLVPVGKAYSGFTDEELLLLDRWIRNHTTESFGPVRAVEPGIVFEVAFDAVQASTRHKSGVAMRFPRIHRIRWDKPAAEADTLDAVQRLLAGNPPPSPAAEMVSRT